MVILFPFQFAVFSSLDMSRSVSVTAAGQCRLAPLIQVILDSSHLYDYTVKLLFKLHSCKFECFKRQHVSWIFCASNAVVHRLWLCVICPGSCWVVGVECRLPMKNFGNWTSDVNSGLWPWGIPIKLKLWEIWQSCPLARVQGSWLLLLQLIHLPRGNDLGLNIIICFNISTSDQVITRDLCSWLHNIHFYLHLLK